jgi:hypothetical protein
MTTPDLQAAVRRAYDVFGGRQAPSGHLNVCTNCCMSEELEREMRTLPLRSLTAQHFYEYCTGAMGDLVQPTEEIRYLLPRWLELLAAGERTHHSVELNLDRVGCCGPGAFDAEEIGVLDSFMLADFDHELDDGNTAVEDSDPLAVIIMADTAGLSVAPLLQYWTAHPGTASTALFVRSTYWDFWPDGELANAFAKDRSGIRAAFKSWMLAPDTRVAFKAKLLEPDFLSRVEGFPCGYRVPFKAMVEAVFDHLN